MCGVIHYCRGIKSNKLHKLKTQQCPLPLIVESMPSKVVVLQLDMSKLSVLGGFFKLNSLSHRIVT